MRFAFFLDNLDSEYQITIYRGIASQARALNIDLLCIQNLDTNPLPSRDLLSVDGILLLSSVIFFKMDMRQLEEYKGTPLVSIGCRLLDYHSILINSSESLKRLMEHLVLTHGYRKLFYMGGPVHHQDNIEREQAFKTYIDTAKKIFPDLEAKVFHGDFYETSGMNIIRDYIDRYPHDPPDCIVAGNDNIAFGLQQFLQNQSDSRWNRCPVTGFDDIRKAKLIVPPLTTIHQPLAEIGKNAVRMLWNISIGNKVPPVVFVESELRIRKSCGCEKSLETEADGQGMDSEYSYEPYQTIKSGYYISNVNNFGQGLMLINSLEEMASHLRLFLAGFNVKTFFLILYPESLNYHGKRKGKLAYKHSSFKEESFLNKPLLIDLQDFFANTISRESEIPQTWCLYHLRSGSELLGFVVYEASEQVYPQMCSGAISIANTIKRLRLLDDEKERSIKLEQEVAYRTKDLVEANRKLKEEAKRRLATEAEILRISEMERLRFSMDLHDDICQRLAGISMFCQGLVARGNPESFLLELSQLIDETLMCTRRYAHITFPVVLDTIGLNEALDVLCYNIRKETGCQCVYEWSVPEPYPLSHDQDINIYRIVQEALQNVMKHANASRVDVRATVRDSVFSVRVQDNGIGNPALNNKARLNFSQKNRYMGLGLRSMQYRADQLGAKYIFQSSRDHGTLVEIIIPLDTGNSPAKSL